MSLVGFREPRWAFVALPFEVRDQMRGYKETLLVLEDSFNIEIKHGDNTNDAVGIFERASDLMSACRVRIFDLTDSNPNVVFEFGHAIGAGLQNTYAVRRKRMFPSKPIPSMLKHIDCQAYKNASGLEKTLHKTLARHFWPTDKPFSLQNLEWLASQIRQLTHPSCETDKYELEAAIGIDSTFITQAIVQYFVPTGEATALTVGPAPRYKFDYHTIREVRVAQPAIR